MQKLYKTLKFGLIKTCQPGNLYWKPLNTIVDQAKETVCLLTSLDFGIDPIFESLFIPYLVLIKLMAIFVILYRFAYWNKSNDISLLMAIYLYFAGAMVDAITFLNYLGISVLYNVLLRKLKSITVSNSAFIKALVSNHKLIGTWDNFDNKENVADKRIGDIVKFRSVTILW